jgi:hypothetical protein
VSAFLPLIRFKLSTIATEATAAALALEDGDAVEMTAL